MKNFVKCLAIIALVAVIGLSMTGCPEEDAVSGTYYCEESYYGSITFSGSDWTAKGYTIPGNGTFSVSGSEIILKDGSMSYYTIAFGKTWTIVDANTVRNGSGISGKNWIKR